jgi:pimeloyl-ACP methyl ester carboxylesterase
VLIVGAAVAATCLLALSAGDAGAVGAPDRVPRANGVGAPIAWGGCDPPGANLQCATIRVPLDWDRPNGRTIRLALIRHLASRPEERIGTLFMNPGGPAESGVGILGGDPEGFDAFGGGRFDVVSWDPRGTNASTRVRCFRDQASQERFLAGRVVPTTKAASERFARKTAALERRCGEISGWLLPHISTADTARDLDHLRVLLGEEKLNYLGLSYGTLIGQTYANLFPDRVRAMVLMGLIDAPKAVKGAEARAANEAGAADEVFNQFLSLCDKAGPERCALAGGRRSAAERVNRLFARTRREPIPAPGVLPPLLSPIELTFGDLLVSQFPAMRSPRMWPDNAANLESAMRGDGSRLQSAASGFSTPAGWAGATTSAAISCADAPARRKLRAWPSVVKRIVRVGRLEGRAEAWWRWATCAASPVRGQDNYRGPWDAATPNPILLINSRYDPNTGYANAVRAEQYLGNAVLLTHLGYGHLSFQNPSTCVDQAMVDYVTELITPPRGTVCQSDQQPFDPDFR